MAVRISAEEGLPFVTTRVVVSATPYVTLAAVQRELDTDGRVAIAELSRGSRQVVSLADASGGPSVVAPYRDENQFVSKTTVIPVLADSERSFSPGAPSDLNVRRGKR